MKRLSALLLALTAGCGMSTNPSSPAGKAKDDAVTAKLRASFANGDTPTIAKALQVAGAHAWTCAYHATTTEIVMRGLTDVSYSATYAPGATGVHETVSGVHAGDVVVDAWAADYRWTQAGLRSPGTDATRLLRLVDGDTVGVEWLYAAEAGDTRGDVAIGDPNLRTLGYASCITAK